MRTNVVIDNTHFSSADSTRNVQTDTFQKLAVVTHHGHCTQYFIIYYNIIVEICNSNNNRKKYISISNIIAKDQRINEINSTLLKS